jgi:hypothetical protein
MADHFDYYCFHFQLGFGLSEGNHTNQLGRSKIYKKKKTGREKSFLNVRLTSSVEIVEITLGDRLRGGMIEKRKMDFMNNGD